MAGSSSSGPPTQRYPSPTQSSLPFYQHDAAAAGAVRPSIELEEEEQQRDGASDPEDPDQHHHHGAVPDDPQLRANLTNLTTDYPAYPHLPPGSVAFAQATNSPSAHPPNALAKAKERSKVSRACDECRRKKIRCDAVDETGATPCSNCARTGAKCAFSRQPMKRGPSKGYIKELAERLNTLESSLGQGGVDEVGGRERAQVEIRQVQMAMAEAAGGFAEPRAGEKRSRDVAEGGWDGGREMGGYGHGHSFAPLPPQAPMAQMQQQQQQNAYYQPPPPQQQHPADVQPFWRRGAGDNRQETVGQPYESGDNNNTAATTTITTFDWDESVIDEYYRIIHQTFPLLPSSKHRLRQRLADCPASLREAFLAALDCLMRTFPTTTLPPNLNYPQALKRAAELIAKYPFDNPSTHTNATNLVYLQTLLLMALESDNHGPATIRGQAGPSRAEWLGRAAGVAGQLEINLIRTGSQSVMEGDRDSEERLARRVWWVLFILDRWHASSTADLLKLPENSVVLLPEDQILLGESTYHLARLSFIIGHLAAILTTTKTPSTDVMAPSNPASSLLGLTLAGEIDRFRESVESVWGSLNLVHLSYHHCHLLIKRLHPQTEPSELVGHAVKVATVLNSRLTPVTPLNHHFGALAAMTLCELADVRETRDEAARGLTEMVEALGGGRGLAGKQESEGWDGAVRELVVRKRERMLAEGVDGGGGPALQSLANAATGASESSRGGFDPTMLTRYGYLTALGQGRFRTR